VQRVARPVDHARAAALAPDRRSNRGEVIELLGVDPGDLARVEALDQEAERRRGGLPGIVPALKGADEHRVAQLRPLAPGQRLHASTLATPTASGGRPNMRAVTVRSAEPGDFDDVVRLLVSLGRVEVTDETRDRCRALYEAQLADAAADHLVAEDGGGAIVGFCSLHYLDRLNYVTPQAWVPDLIVEE